MSDPTLIQVISASVAPAMFISGASMMTLAFLNRQGILTGRLRDLHKKALQFAERAQKENSDYLRARARLALSQGKKVFVRARTVKWVLILLSISMLGFLLTSVGLGLALYYPTITEVATAVFGFALLALFGAVGFALGGALNSLKPLQDEEETTEKLVEAFGITSEETKK